MQDFEGPFPFNLDEFVTVDEVGDEAEEHTASSGDTKLKTDDFKSSIKKSVLKRKSSADAYSEKIKKPLTSATLKSRPSADTEAEQQEVTDMMENEPTNSVLVKEEKEAEKVEEVAGTTDVLQEAIHQTVFGEIDKEAILTPESLESEVKNKESVPQENVEEASITEEETSNKESLHNPNQLDFTSFTLKDEPSQVSKLQEQDSTAEDQSKKSDTAVKEVESKVLLSQDALVTLDEVGGEDVDFADEEELLKRQAGENPETLLTVDEVGGDEADAEEEQLQKALQDLVTLDEIVEDEDDAGSFNPEVSIFTLSDTCFKLLCEQ